MGLTALEPGISRRSIRLKGYDYSLAGAYFVTISTQDRSVCVRRRRGGCHVSQRGRADGLYRVGHIARPVSRRRSGRVRRDAQSHPRHHSFLPRGVSVGAPLVGAQDVAPNRTIDNRATTRVAPTLGDVVGAFKSRVTVEYTRGVKTKGWPAFRRRLWQRNFYEHIIRNEVSLNHIRQYILDNPARWAFDRDNPLAVTPEPEGIWQV